MRKPFSKKLLIMDYIIAVSLIIGYFACVIANGLYFLNVLNMSVCAGNNISSYDVPTLFNLDGFGILLSTWIVQLGVSSGAYYVMAKADHQVELPMKLINEMPKEIKESVDMTQVITTVLSTTNN